MKIRVIACRVFAPEMEYLLKLTSDDVSIEFLPLRAHDQPDTLRTDIQALVDDARNVDAVVLAYGLCGNATAGIRAGNVPLYIPKAHDCSQILLGGMAEHQRFFKDNPSRGWTSRGYIEEGGDVFRSGDSNDSWTVEDLIEQYGEENARYVIDILHSSDSNDDKVLYFLDIPETSNEAVYRDAREKAESRSKNIQIIPGTLNFLSRLLGGKGGKEILRLAPGESIMPSWDEDVIKPSVIEEPESNE